VTYIARAINADGTPDFDTTQFAVEQYERDAFTDVGCVKITYTFDDGSKFEIEKSDAEQEEET
jgi:hypothetical protein